MKKKRCSSKSFKSNSRRRTDEDSSYVESYQSETIESPSEYSDSDSRSSEENNSIIESENDYFDLDTSLLSVHLGNILVKNITKEYRSINLDPLELKEIVKNSISQAETIILAEYSTAKPKDELWKAECKSQKELSILENELAKLRLANMDRQPSIIKILESELCDKDKMEALQLFDISNNLEPFSLDHHTVIQSIQTILENSGGIPIQDLKKIEDEQKRLNFRNHNDDFKIKLQIYNLNAPDDTKLEIYNTYEQYIQLKKLGQDYDIIKQKLMWMVNLPYRKFAPLEVSGDSSSSDIQRYCASVYDKLNKQLYGMKNVKEKILQFVLNRITNPQSNTMLGLCSPPGRGKTAIASALAKAMNKPFERVSLGGLLDSSILKGSDSVWKGASPSILLQILKRTKISNGIILFDELDKLSTTEKGKEVQHALLHITDYVQNSEFQDLYISEIKHDLSRLWFIFAMNDDKIIDPALKDRLDILHIPSYTQSDVNHIIVNHFLPKALVNSGLTEGSMDITESVCNLIQSIHLNTSDTQGLRPIEKSINDIVSKVNLYNVCSYGENPINLSFSIPDFKGYPYTITRKTMEYLNIKKSDSSSYLSYYS